MRHTLIPEECLLYVVVIGRLAEGREGMGPATRLDDVSKVVEEIQSRLRQASLHKLQSSVKTAVS